MTWSVVVVGATPAAPRRPGLRIRYAAEAREPVWRTLDPIGLVTVRDKGYLLATVDGGDRTYRLSRILAAEALDEPAQRDGTVDLAAL